MWLPSVGSVEEIHGELVSIFKGENDPISPCGVKSYDMLASACERPNVSLGGIEKYPSIELKISALFHSLTKNHPFHNGNKRTALVVMLCALYKNDRKFVLEVSDDVIYNFVLEVTGNEFPVKNHLLSVDDVVIEIARWLKQNTQSVGGRLSGMKPEKFAKNCEKAGANVRLSEGRYKISYSHARGVSFKNGKKKLPVGVVRSFISKLGLGESHTGISYDDFCEGASSERDQMYRFMAALRRLART